MKNRIGGGILALALAGMISLNAGCRESPGDKQAGLPLESRERREGAEAVPPDKENGPRLGLMVNQMNEVDTYPGWPILVELRIRHPRLYNTEAKAEPMTIASTGESWTEAITLLIRTADGKTVQAPLKFRPPDEGTLTLDDRQTGVLSWWLAGEDTMKFAEGDYLLRATLDTRGVEKTGRWRGKADSESVAFHFKKEPSPLNDDLAEEKLILLATCAQALGKGDQSKEYVDTLLAARPESLQGLALKAGQIEAEGDPAGALKTYQQALAIFFRRYPDAEPPYELWSNHRRLRTRLREK